ncbi:ABC transporter permease [Haloferacaceae archaeon DSL9]
MPTELYTDRSTDATRSRRFRQVTAFVRRYLRTLTRDRTVLVWSLAFPAAFYLLTISVFVDLAAIPEAHHGSVKATTAISYGVFGAVIVCLTAFGGQLVSDLESGRYAAFRTLPLGPGTDLAGRFLAGLVAAGGAFLVVILVSLPTGATYAVDPIGIPLAAGAFVASALVWMVVALGIAVGTKRARYANLISVSLALASYFGTGFNGTVPASFDGDADLLNVLPNTVTTRLLTARLVDVGDPVAAGLAPPALPTGWSVTGLLCGYVALFGGAAWVIARRVLYAESGGVGR